MEIEEWTTEPPLGQGRNKEIKDFFKFKENEDTIYPNLWDTMKAMLKGNMKETENSH